MTTDLRTIALGVVVVTVIIALLLIGVALLIAINNNRRIKHAADLAELAHKHAQEVMMAEREATRQTFLEIGRELHDNVGQYLVVAQMGLRTAVTEKPGEPRISAALEALDIGVEEVRRLGHSLNTDLWHGRSLEEAIKDAGGRIERATRVKVTVNTIGDWPMLMIDMNTILYRVFQEILQNALKHSRAKHVIVTLEASDRPTMTITDDGRGFDPATVKESNGLLNIRKRCALIGFSAECSSAPGKGCTWRFRQIGEHPYGHPA